MGTQLPPDRRKQLLLTALFTFVVALLILLNISACSPNRAAVQTFSKPKFDVETDRHYPGKPSVKVRGWDRLWFWQHGKQEPRKNPTP